MTTNGKDDANRERYFQEQAFRLMIVARELAKRVGFGAAGGVIIRLTPVLAHDDPPHAITEITLQIEQEPNNAELYLKRGELHRISSHWDLALADFDRVAQSPPGTAWPMHRAHLQLSRSIGWAEKGDISA